MLRVKEVCGRVSHTCIDCFREIQVNEYKTELVQYEDGKVWSEYTCCRKPWEIKVYGKIVFDMYEEQPPF